MRRNLACGSPVVLGVAAVLACGPSQSDACAKYFEASISAQSTTNTLTVGHDTAKARFVASCEARMALPDTSFTPSFLEACADTLNAVGYLPTAAQYDACATRPGGRAVGAPCEDDSQCASTRCSATTSCGTCVATIAAGGACAIGDACIGGTTCDSGTCTGASFAKLGQACDDTATLCDVGLVCVSGACSPGLAAGATCARYSDCASGLRCAFTGQPTGTCVSDPAPGYAAPGAACSADAPCFVGDCNGTCPTPIADGESCDPTSGPPCDSFAQCIDGTCRVAFSVACN